MNSNLKTALIIGGTIVVVLIVLPLVLGPRWGGQWGGGMMGPGMMGGFGWGFGPILMIVFWGLVIWGIVALVRGVAGSGGCDSHYGTTDSAIEVLKRRYARGEIRKEEFEEKKKDLG